MSVSLANMASSPTNLVTGAPLSSPGNCGGVLSPRKIKVEPKFVQSPCTGPNKLVGNTNGGGSIVDHWMSSPSPQLHSPPAMSPTSFGHVNGHLPGQHPAGNLPPTHVTSNGFSPLSCSSYETYSPNGKEEMSPPSSLNGYTHIDSYGDSKLKKKGPAPRQQEELCLVCGDRASGYHYNALTCEGCKGFFRRSITKDAVYQCKYGNNCEIDMYMRRKCQQCRLRKCLTVGMRPECVVPEAQCAMKRESKRAQKEKDKPNSTTREPPVPVYVAPDTHKEIISSPISVQLTRPILEITKRISPEQEELINRLVYFQEEFESPSDEDLRTVTEFPLGDRSEDGDMRLKHVTEITILTVQLIVEFSKRLPGFDTLLREDQITLLKACSSEVMMLRCARKYDINTDSIVFANNQPYTRENYFSASVGDSADAIFSFCKHLCQMKVDNAEFALLTALVIFSERPSLVEPKKVEKIQEIYVDALKTYIENHTVKQAQKFARLLAVLTELRSLGNANLEMCFSLKVKNKNLPAFLAEIWDIQT